MNHEQCCDFTKGNSKACLLVSDQLPNFLRTLRANRSHGLGLGRNSFSINIFDTFNTQSLQTQLGVSLVPVRIRSLLDPFTILYGVEFLGIEGMVDEEYKQAIIASATQPEPTIAEIITAASAIETRGDEAFRKQQFNLSLSLYTSAIRDFQVNLVAGYSGILTTGKYAGMSIPNALRSFSISLHSNMAAALVKTGEYKKAIRYATATLKHIYILDTPQKEWLELCSNRFEVAIVFFWGGLAFEGIGDIDRALYGLENAMNRHPENESFAKEYVRLMAKNRIQGTESTKDDFWFGHI